MRERGIWVAIDGLDAVGKSTQVSRVAESIRSNNIFSAFCSIVTSTDSVLFDTLSIAISLANNDYCTMLVF